MKFHISRLMITALSFSFILPMAAQVGGTGTTNRIPLWTGSTSLGNSVLFQSGGNVGIGNTAPSAILDVKGKTGTSGVNNGNAPTALQVIGGLGASNGFFGSVGGPVQAASGGGGRTNGALGGTGAMLLMTGAGGAHCRLIVGSITRCSQVFDGGNGGSLSLQPGSGGSSFTGGSGGHPGNITLAPSGGKVGVGTSNPTAGFEVGPGHSTLADSWVTRSSRFKTNITPLVGALDKIELLQGVSYQRKADGKHEIGVVAEDVDQVVPELVDRDPDTMEVQGVDYSRLSALLIEAIKTQQSEIQELKAQVRRLTSDRRTFDVNAMTTLEPHR